MLSTEEAHAEERGWMRFDRTRTWKVGHRVTKKAQDWELDIFRSMEAAVLSPVRVMRVTSPFVTPERVRSCWRTSVGFWPGSRPNCEERNDLRA